MELVSLLTTGALGGLFTYTGIVGASQLTVVTHVEVAALYVTVALPLCFLVVLFAGILHVGLTSRFTNDDDREWLSRFGGWLLIVASCWGVFSAVVMFGPWLLARLSTEAFSLVAPLGGFFGGIAGVLGRN